MNKPEILKLIQGPAVWRGALLLLLLLLGGLYAYLMRPGVVGMLYDDGMYLMSAKALATGHGYRLTGIEGQPYFYKYPPLYPLCLAAIWLLNPHFPQNIIWLKALNILFSLGALGLLAYHLRRNLNVSRGISLALVACLGLNFRWIDVSIELMSEPLFLLLSLGALVLAHRAHCTTAPLKAPQVIWLILFSLAAFYTRSIGLVLVPALGLWLWLRKERKTALGYTALCGLLMLPWFAWSASRADTTYTVGHFLVRTFQETYLQSLRMDLRYEYSLPELYGKGLQTLIGNFSVACLPLLEWFFRSKATIFSDCVILGFSFGLLGIIGWRAYAHMKNGDFSPSGLYMAMYALILPSWSFFQFYPRFMIVVMPLCYAALALAILEKKWPQPQKTMALGSLLALILISNLLHLWPYLNKPVPNTLTTQPYYDVWKDYELVNQYIKTHTPLTAVLYTDNADENYAHALHTNRNFVDFYLMYPQALWDRECDERDVPCLVRQMLRRTDILYLVLKQKHAQYIIYPRFSIIKKPNNNWRLTDKAFRPVELLLKKHPHSFQPVMQTPDGWMTIYRFQPDKEPG